MFARPRSLGRCERQALRGDIWACYAPSSRLGARKVSGRWCEILRLACKLEADVMPSWRLGCHAPVARRLARSWLTVARSAPGSLRPSAAKLSEMRATESRPRTLT